MSNYSCWPTFFAEWGYLCLCRDRYPVNTLIRLIFWISNIFHQRLKLVLHLNLTYFRRNFEYPRWPIRYFAKCSYVISRMALLVNAYTSRSVCKFYCEVGQYIGNQLPAGPIRKQSVRILGPAGLPQVRWSQWVIRTNIKTVTVPKDKIRPTAAQKNMFKPLVWPFEGWSIAYGFVVQGTTEANIPTSVVQFRETHRHQPWLVGESGTLFLSHKINHQLTNNTERLIKQRL